MDDRINSFNTLSPLPYFSLRRCVVLIRSFGLSPRGSVAAPWFVILPGWRPSRLPGM